VGERDRTGVKCNDADLIGAPYQLVIGGKGLAQGLVEVKNRRAGEVIKLSPTEVAIHIKSRLTPFS